MIIACIYNFVAFDFHIKLKAFNISDFLTILVKKVLI